MGFRGDMLEALHHSITLAADMVTSTWAPARVVWDGGTQIDSGNKYTDHAGTDDGALFIFGTPTSQGTVAFADQAHEAVARFHSCTKLPNGSHDIPVAGVRRRLYEQRCEQNLVLRLSLVRDRFGLVISLIVNPEAEARALDRFIARLAGVRWTP